MTRAVWQGQVIAEPWADDQAVPRVAFTDPQIAAGGDTSVHEVAVEPGTTITKQVVSLGQRLGPRAA